MSKLLSDGLTYMFRGMRLGRSPMAAVGAAMSIAGFLRNRRKPARELIYARTLKEGEAIRIRFLRGAEVVGQHDVEV